MDSEALVPQYFQQADDRFMAELRKLRNPQALITLVEDWKRDHRPWAREQQIAYLRAPFNLPGHEPVVKRLFKHAEQRGDDPLMAEFPAAFDRLVRRVRRKRFRYDWQSRSSWVEHVLSLPHDTLSPRFRIQKNTGRKLHVQSTSSKPAKLFTFRTRCYLRRRAARYFRRLGRSHPERYVPAVCLALRRYTDGDLSTGEHLLESWSLLQIAYRRSPVLAFGPERVKVRDGRNLGQLEPTPRYAELWRSADAGRELVGLMLEAQSRLVRKWALDMLRREHAQSLQAFDLETIFTLLEHADPEIQQLGAEFLLDSQLTAQWPLDAWLRLLEIPNPTILSAVCDAMRRAVPADRLTFDQCLTMACSAPTPVSRLGLRALQTRRTISPTERKELVRLADAPCEATAPALAAWALQQFSQPGAYHADHVLPFFDSLALGVRRAAWRWMMEQSPAYHDPVVWARLTETPFDDLRMLLVDALKTRRKLPGTTVDDLAPVWSGVLLNVHRGGRTKPHAAGQLASAVAADPDRASSLLPVLAVVVRSLRSAERRAGLAAVLKLLTERPELADQVQKHLPELELDPSEAR